MVGAQVKPGMYDQTITHYNVLRMIEGFYDLPLAGASANAAPIAMRCCKAVRGKSRFRLLFRRNGRNAGLRGLRAPAHR